MSTVAIYADVSGMEERAFAASSPAFVVLASGRDTSDDARSGPIHS